MKLSLEYLAVGTHDRCYSESEFLQQSRVALSSQSCSEGFSASVHTWEGKNPKNPWHKYWLELKLLPFGILSFNLWRGDGKAAGIRKKGTSLNSAAENGIAECESDTKPSQRACDTWHFQPQGLSQIYNFMEFKALNPLVFALSYYFNNFMSNPPKYKSYRVCFSVWN